MKPSRRVWLAGLAAGGGSVLAGETVARATIRPAPRKPADEAALPGFFRLGHEPFTAENEAILGGNGVRRELVRFPSPVTTPHVENNTVHAEFFAPAELPAGARRPAVLLLHIAGGDFPLMRLVAANLAQAGTLALFVKLPYYGERRPPGGQVKFLDGDLARGVAAMKQAVLDLRRACDWLQARPECDGRLGTMGISLGAIVGGLAAAAEPRLTHACLVMGAAKLEDILYGSAERDAKRFRAKWEAAGGDRAGFAAAVRDVDASTYGDRLRRRIVALHSAAHDEVIPRTCNDALWEAAGRPCNHWYPCGHYTMALHLPGALAAARRFFRDWPAEPLPPAPPPPPCDPRFARSLFAPQ